jgi:hypothetical protein
MLQRTTRYKKGKLHACKTLKKKKKRERINENEAGVTTFKVGKG